jgi:hypothetical protein
MSDIIKFFLTWIFLLSWMGFLLGALVVASEAEERWKRNTLFVGIGIVTISSSFVAGYVTSISRRK